MENMAVVEGDFDCCDSTDTRSLHSDSETESYKYPQFNPKIDGDNPILALELTFGSKREFKNVVATHEIKKGKYIKWSKNDKEELGQSVYMKNAHGKLWHPKCNKTNLFRLKHMILCILAKSGIMKIEQLHHPSSRENISKKLDQIEIVAWLILEIE